VDSHLDALRSVLEGLVAHKVALVVVQPELRQHGLQHQALGLSIAQTRAWMLASLGRGVPPGQLPGRSCNRGGHRCGGRKAGGFGGPVRHLRLCNWCSAAGGSPTAPRMPHAVAVHTATHAAEDLQLLLLPSQG
jgi:hypothetical protein